MKEIIKKKFAYGIRDGTFKLVDDMGVVIDDVVNAKIDKVYIKYNFNKMNNDIREILIERLGLQDYFYFNLLCSYMTKYGSIDVCMLDDYLNKEVRMRKIRKFKKEGLMKKLKIEGLVKKYYFINPYVCHKTKAVWQNLVDNFEPIK